MFGKKARYREAREALVFEKPSQGENEKVKGVATCERGKNRSRVPRGTKGGYRSAAYKELKSLGTGQGERLGLKLAPNGEIRTMRRAV